MGMATLGLLFEKEAARLRWRYGLNAFQRYAEEVLAYAGIPFTVIHNTARLHEFDIVIAGFIRDTPESAEALWTYAANGGAVVAYAGLNKLAERLGCVRRQASGVGYAVLPAFPDPVRFLQADIWEPKASVDDEAVRQDADGAYGHDANGIRHDANAAIRCSGVLRGGTQDGAVVGPALLRFKTGLGEIHRWAVDIPTTVVAFQQGTEPVLQDGVPARDGTGNLDEHILKADDRCEMDWDLDRRRTETGAVYYAHPYADYWRDALVGHLLETAASRGLALPFVDAWPEGVEHVAMISFDSDMNDDEAAETTLEMLREHGVPTTWCIIEPGFGEAVYRRAKREGHELAMHYNALAQERGEWSEKEFNRQFEWLKRATGQRSVTSNKNHYTRFEGWGELFRWCEACGIESDQTRGPSKKGNIGFLFGTCRPYFPISWFDEENRLYDVLEIGFLTQDLNHYGLADVSVAVPFLEQVRKVRGVAHFLFHQIHIHQQAPVREAFGTVVREAKRRGFEFWTGKQMNDWERSRRSVKIRDVREDGIAVVETDGLPRDAVVWIPAAATSAADGRKTERRFGVPCVKQIVRASAAPAEGVGANAE